MLQFKQVRVRTVQYKVIFNYDPTKTLQFFFFLEFYLCAHVLIKVQFVNYKQNKKSLSRL